MSIFGIICLILVALCVGACVVYFFLTYNIPVWAALLLAAFHFCFFIGLDIKDPRIMAASIVAIGGWWIIEGISVEMDEIRKKDDE